LSKLLSITGFGLVFFAAAAIFGVGHKAPANESLNAQATHIASPVECRPDYWNPEKKAD
jgi:hypothetical protein